MHRYYVQPAVQPALVDICNTWDNADTAVTGNTPAFHPENEPGIHLPEAATPVQGSDLLHIATVCPIGNKSK